MSFSQWLNRNQPFLRIVLVFLLFMAAAYWLPPELPTPNAAHDPVVKLTPPLLKLPALQIEMLFSSRPSLQQDALALTKNDLLKYLRPQAQMDAWEMCISQISFIGTDQDCVVAALSLPASEGMLCILVPQNHQYTLFHIKEGFLPIKGLASIITETGLNSDQTQELLLVTEDTTSLKNQTTQPHETVRYSLWLWQEDHLQPIAIPSR
jgi:hypothetical protein